MHNNSINNFILALIA